MSWRTELIGGDPVEVFERYKILPEDLDVVEWDLDCEKRGMGWDTSTDLRNWM